MISERLGFGSGQGEIGFKNGAYTVVREYFESNFNAALGQKMSALKSFLVGVLPDDAVNRTRLHRFFNTILRTAFGQDDFCFFLFFIKCKNLGAKFNTALTADAFISIDYDSSGHGSISFYALVAGPRGPCRKNLT